jgi:methylenetetrahydrofolate dehydrogenase (NADP+) / methenyltetrahydrofolate cyclohydrolase
MAADLLNGRKIARRVERRLAKDVAAFVGRTGITPRLVVVLVGDDPRSQSYIRTKTRVCERAGVDDETMVLPRDSSEADVITLVRELNADASVHGILVQDPVPSHISSLNVLLAIDPTKDVDGFHPHNVGMTAIGAPVFESCTPRGIMQMLSIAGHDPAGKHVVIVGRSNIVGKPLMNMLVQKAEGANATVTVCHTGTPDVAEHTRRADILIVSAGRPEIITGDMLKPGCVVVDVGINPVDDETAERGYRLVGDVHFESASEVAAAITPVPGGVGPMTCVMLAENTLRAARLQVGGEA